MQLHIQPVTSHLRIFDDGLSYDAKDQFLFVCTISYLGDGEIWISGAKGILTRKMHTMMRNRFREDGIKVVRYEKSKPQVYIPRRYNI